MCCEQIELNSLGYGLFSVIRQIEKSFLFFDFAGVHFNFIEKNESFGCEFSLYACSIICENAQVGDFGHF